MDGSRLLHLLKDLRNLLSSHWPHLAQALQSKYEIIDEIDIFSIVPFPQQVAHLFKKFQNYTFKPNQRLVITHIDVGFYLRHCPYSLNLYNLFHILTYYDIPTEFVILVTNQKMDKEVECLSKIFNTAPFKVISSFYNIVQTIPSGMVNTGLDSDLIEYPYISLNGVPRPSRFMLLSMLKNKDLLDKGIVSWNFDPNALNFTDASGDPKEDLNVPFLSPHNLGLGNEHLIFDDFQHQSYNTYSSIFRDTTYKHPLIVGEPNGIETRWQPKFLKHALAYVVTETVGDYPYAYLSEKTFKGLLTKRPMLIVGASQSIAMLKQLGFKTWGNYWDEGYDNLPDLSSRLNAVVSIIEDLCSKSPKELQTICKDMEDILEYNYHWYINGFADEQLKKLVLCL